MFATRPNLYSPKSSLIVTTTASDNLGKYKILTNSSITIGWSDMVVSLKMCAPSHASCISLLPPDWTSRFLVWFLLRRPIMTKVEPRLMLMLMWFGHYCIQTLSSSQFNLWSSKHLADKMNDYVYVWCLTWMVVYSMQWWCATNKDADVQRELLSWLKV